MKNRKEIAMLRKLTGKVFVDMLIKEDVVMVQVVKSDLIKTLSECHEGAVNIREQYGCLFVSNN